MPNDPLLDINLFVHDGAQTLGQGIESVLAQSVGDFRLTLIDDGSSDATPDILQYYARQDSRVCLKHNRCNTGAVGAFQRGFWLGNADFVMPKSADDLIAPDFVREVLAVLRASPDCVMAHAAGLSFSTPGDVNFVYPPAHCLHAVGDPLARAASVMRTYTSSPSFWGIYRRSAVDRLAPIACRAGWDHVLLAELALYGEIRHVPEVMYWRRGAGRSVADLARAATAEWARGLGVSDVLADPLWCAPCITTAYAHIETFSIARLDAARRHRLIEEVPLLFGWRWGRLMDREIDAVRLQVSRTLADAPESPPLRQMLHLQLTRLLTAASLLRPRADLWPQWHALAALASGSARCAA